MVNIDLINSTPRVTADLIIKDTVIYNRKYYFRQWKYFFKDNYLEFDIALRDKSSINPVKLAGTYPLN